jgi:2-polyprenyl-3-methyl-5-hydroxy-6-metoxy-1,4-benzoquinol methylase
MNRRERRAAMARGRPVSAEPADLAALMAEASQAHRDGRPAKAEELCQRVLSSDPDYPPGLNLLGLIKQTSGHHRQAVRMFLKAIAVDAQNAACHYNLASSYQLLGQRDAAAAHFKKAIALGLSDKNVEDFILQNPEVAARVNRTAANGPALVAAQPQLNIAAIAKDVFLQCALQSTLICGVPLELFLTGLRAAMLQLSDDDAAKTIDDATAELFCALAQQCFINEYVYTCGESERQKAAQLRDVLQQKLGAGDRIPVILLAAVAAYFPLFSLSEAQSLLTKTWPDCVADLLRQQVREPLEEAEDRKKIQSLTTIDDPVSRDVMAQYEENPYPRWTIGQAAEAPAAQPPSGQDILIAGCGTGQHAFAVAEHSPGARILAIDMSLTSLAYARRKTREAKLRNIDYAQADILKLGAIGRSFDRIESVGVLHHLADPKAGWRVLLSLLKPGGVLRVGLYSTAARRAIAEARATVAERGYRPTPDGIRALRQTIVGNRHEPRWNLLLATADDFYSVSGCRDLFFNVMEHTFTIPDVAALLAEYGLSFLGFELDDDTLDKFRSRFPAADALTDFDCWNAFEIANPQTFRHMYVFSVRRKETG